MEVSRIKYEITVDVKSADIKTKKKVQDAFRKLDLVWSWSDKYENLDKDAYTNTLNNGVVTGKLMYVNNRPIKPTHTIEELLELVDMKTKEDLKPFDLEKALAGEPVVLRNGDRGYVRYHETQLGRAFPLIGFVVNKEQKHINLTTWTIKGSVCGERSESPHDIAGMWVEPLVFEHWDLLCEDIKYIAKDNEENWWGYVCKPIQNKTHREWVIGGMHDGELTLDAFELEGLNPTLFPNCDWKDSLIKRPEK